MLAIVGGGANGAATFIHLVLKLITEPIQACVSLVLIEKDEEFGPGLAYGTEERGHILNTAAGLMGIFAEEPMHFVTWLQQNQSMVQEKFPGVEIHAHAYVPRRLYGQYVKDVLEEYVQLARQHEMDVKLLRDEAVDAEVAEDNVVLKLESGGTVEADVAVLATGTPKPSNFTHLRSSPHYFDFPWPAHPFLKTIPRDAAVSILGTSLTAIDTVVAFLDHGHTGKLTLYSRHGLLPRIQTPFDVSFEREILTRENIRKIIRQKKRALRAKDLFRLFQAEAERVMGKQDDWKKFNRVDKPHLELLKYDVEVAKKGESTFQNIAFSTRYLAFHVWKLLPAKERVLFMKWFGPHWDINRHGMPLQNGYKLLKMLESGQLTIKAHSSNVEWKKDEKLFYMHLDDGKVDKAPYLINATGTAKKVKNMEVPLLQELLRKALIVPHQAGGVQADPHTLQLHVPDHPDAPLYGVGQLLVGELFDTNSVWFNVARIDYMTTDILRRIS
ncbi:hypothetical protein DXT99_06565 [Pontibacter diazotrophicus]|uniref:FAD-dependent urate hydroxylase HpyO/Asp monooxygenase CreE-like FAD/NAD(P)-binding domain-containing protein n=2 Tax=Pontibacter diazotrophicus TaxID=1400979 RepID=A0A3D8LF54_9BACT|nr:hypothetical protein DXT99_06565 [Pontibacter diazotrophicus]